MDGVTAPKVLVVSPIEAEERVRRVISKHASSMSESAGDIDTIFRKSNLISFASENSQLINRKAPTSSATRILLFENIVHQEEFGQGLDYRTSNVFKGLSQFEKAFPSILRQSGLDWKTEAINYLGHWSHGTIDELHINRWLGQFTKIGEEWIGEHLLKCIDFWSPQRIREALDCNEATLKEFKIIGLKRGEAGKSGDILANILKKRFAHLDVSPPPIEDFYRICTEPKLDHTPILFVEDCLLTGTEITKYLGKLLGIYPEKNPRSSIQALTDPQWLRNAKIEFRFAVWTELGERRLKRFLADQEMNSTVNCSKLGKLDILTDEGRSAVTDGTIDHPEHEGWLSNSERQIDCIAFRAAGKRNRKVPYLRKFCEEIGVQLFQRYVTKNGWTWDPERVKMASLGMLGFGLNLAFYHSIPKSTLPLFWLGGEIAYQQKKITWEPLFESA